MEERCLRLEWSLASQSLKISALESKIAALDAEYDNNVQRLRELKCEVEELEEAEKEKDGFYRAQTGEMKDFKEATNGFVVDCQICWIILLAGSKAARSKRKEQLRAHVLFPE
ncbi:uncharacterized protein LOC104439618 [Eucalyptus grandis]|uniref:uncharacterized protein LOC104439618 n=1 Tax=Eucalyptus grandis TaxID=71139 RepID=UPI00192EC609|nr:uncharacterized protein LOC104439618 [Eucalyptus grandis]